MDADNRLQRLRTIHLIAARWVIESWSWEEELSLQRERDLQVWLAQTDQCVAFTRLKLFWDNFTHTASSLSIPREQLEAFAEQLTQWPYSLLQAECHAFVRRIR